MATVTPLHRPDHDPPIELHDRALDNLQFIRRTMESSGQFTAVSGLGGILLGVTGMVAAFIAGGQPTAEAWTTTWLIAAAVGIPSSGWAVLRKTRRAGVPLFQGSGRKFVLGLAPALVAGAALTVVLFRKDLVDLLPGTWLLLYGVGIVTAGAFSVRVIPLLGLSFMLVGIVALFSPAAWGNALMGVGFGGLHLVFGAVITWRYGG
jgi:hypothetical protein